MLTPTERAELSRLLALYRDELTAEAESADTRDTEGRFALYFAGHAVRSAGDLIRRLEAK